MLTGIPMKPSKSHCNCPYLHFLFCRLTLMGFFLSTSCSANPTHNPYHSSLFHSFLHTGNILEPHDLAVSIIGTQLNPPCLKEHYINFRMYFLQPKTSFRVTFSLQHGSMFHSLVLFLLVNLSW